ncbi:hypothetical protein FKM82_029629 [Ascaphus truei]
MAAAHTGGGGNGSHRRWQRSLLRRSLSLYLCLSRLTNLTVSLYWKSKHPNPKVHCAFAIMSRMTPRRPLGERSQGSVHVTDYMIIL